MITDINLFHDPKRNIYFIRENWRSEPMPFEIDLVMTFPDNPFSVFKPVTSIDFGGTLYKFRSNFIAVNYPSRPKYCRWVLFKKLETQTLDQLISFIIELDDANSLPT